MERVPSLVVNRSVVQYLKAKNRAYFQEIATHQIQRHQRREKLVIVKTRNNSSYQHHYPRPSNPEAGRPLVLPPEKKIKINAKAIHGS